MLQRFLDTVYRGADVRGPLPPPAAVCKCIDGRIAAAGLRVERVSDGAHARYDGGGTIRVSLPREATYRAYIGSVTNEQTGWTAPVEHYVADEALHELNHARFATAARRAMPNYGLGSNLDAQNTQRVVSALQATYEEYLTCVAAAYTAWHCGADAPWLAHLMKLVGPRTSERAVREPLAIFVADGYIAPDGAPTDKMRGREPLRAVRERLATFDS